MADCWTGFDSGLFGVWPAEPVYGVAVETAAGAQKLQRRVGRVWLEVKAAEGAPAEELRRLLNDMTVEMRRQFDYFRGLRAAADAVPEGADEAQQKLARADVKAATDAMSLIVRTLEKVDALQRQLARDRDEAAEKHADALGRAEARAHFLRLIDERAEERAGRLFEAWKQQHLDELRVDGAGLALEPPG